MDFSKRTPVSKFPTRRTVLAGIGAAASLPFTSQFASAATSGLVDAHCHAWSSDTAKYPLNEGRTVADLKPMDVPAQGLLEREAGLGVSKVVLVQHIWYHGNDSTYLTDMAKSAPGHFAVVGAVGETNPEGPDLMHVKKAEGVKGFRVRGFDTDKWVGSDVMNQMFEVAATENLNICPLIRNNKNMSDDALLHLDALCAKHPETVVSIDHMGTVMPGDTEQLARLTGLAKHPNVYVKISGMNKFDAPPYEKLKAQIGTLIEAYGVERLMWGSDLPVLEYEAPHTLDASFALVNTGLGLTENEKAWLLRGSAEKAFF